MYACRALSRLPAQENGHPLYNFGLSLLRALIEAGADVRAMDDAGVCPAVLRSPATASSMSLYQSVWPAVRQLVKSQRTKMVVAQKTRAKYAANVENAHSNVVKDRQLLSPSTSMGSFR